MRKALVAIILLCAIASATSVNITLNKDNDTRYEHQEDYTITVTIVNLGPTNDTFDVRLDTDGQDVEVNDTDRYAYNITNMSVNASYARSVTIYINKSMAFDDEQWFTVEVYNESDLVGQEHLEINTVQFSSIVMDFDYDPNNASNADVTLTGKNSLDEDTYRWNATFHVYNASGDCYNISTNTSSTDLDLENCTSGVYDIKAIATADEEFVENTKINDYFLFRYLTLTADFYLLELFDFQRPFSEVSRITGGDTIVMKGVARYDDGTAIGYSPDTSSSLLNLTIEVPNITDPVHTITVQSDGTYEFRFDAPANTSNYILSLDAYGYLDYEKTVEYTLKVNNTRDYIPEPVNESEIMTRLNISLGNQSLDLVDGELVLDVAISNDNLIGISGKPTLVEEGTNKQFAVTEPSRDSVSGRGSRNYTLGIRPKNYTRPGDYALDIQFSTIYGSISKSIQLTVPEEELVAGELNVVRYIDYKSESQVTLKVVNKHAGEAQARIRETISKDIMPYIVEIDNLIAGCGTTDATCKLGKIVDNGTCSDCDTVDWNQTDCFLACGAGNETCRANCTSLTTNCSTDCTNRTRLTFAPAYARLIEADPVVEWDVDLAAGATTELVYTTTVLVDETWFTEPVIDAGLEIIATPTPAATPTPTPEATPEANATQVTNGEPEPPSGIPMWLLVFVGIMFLVFVGAAGGIAYVFTNKRDQVDDFLDKYLPERELTEEDIQRRKIRGLFVTEEMTKEAPKPKPAPEPEAKESMLGRLDKMFSPKKKEEAPTKYEPKKGEEKPKKEEKKKMPDFKELKDIGKGFGDGS
ncbi:hypothetical protein ACFLQ2_00020 [archaeon]